MKKPAFPNDEFRTQADYFDFTDKHGVRGADAYILKRQLDKQSHALEPKLKKKFLKETL